MPTGIYKRRPRPEYAKIATGLKNKTSLLKNKNAISKPVYAVSRGFRIIMFNTIKEGSKYTGARQSNISNALHGRAKTAGGYKWYFSKPIINI